MSGDLHFPNWELSSMNWNLRSTNSPKRRCLIQPHRKIKANLFVCTSERIWSNGDTDPNILILGIRWTWATSSTLRPLYPRFPLKIKHEILAKTLPPVCSKPDVRGFSASRKTSQENWQCLELTRDFCAKQQNRTQDNKNYATHTKGKQETASSGWRLINTEVLISP